MADEAQCAFSERNQVMIHDVKMQALQVWDIAGNVNRQYLPSAVGGRLGSDAKPVHQHAAFPRPVAFSDDRLVRSIMSDHDRQRLHGIDVCTIQCRQDPQPGHQCC